MKDYEKYAKEHQRYKELTKGLFWFQKYKNDAWVKGENFGDYLSKVIVAETAQKAGYKKSNIKDQKFLAIGSILHFAVNDDIVWGSGINGKIPLEYLKFDRLDVRAIRGPLTQKILHSKGVVSPDNFGDPALLLPLFFDAIYKPIKNKVIVIPNLNEYKQTCDLVPKDMQIISPFTYWKTIVKEMLSSEVVLTSSLHGLIVAEAYGVPVYLFKPFGGETMFKYIDYIEGSGRVLKNEPKSFLDGVDIKNGVRLQKLKFEKEKILSSFPYDKFEK